MVLGQALVSVCVGETFTSSYPGPTPEVIPYLLLSVQPRQPEKQQAFGATCARLPSPREVRAGVSAKPLAWTFCTGSSGKQLWGKRTSSFSPTDAVTVSVCRVFVPSLDKSSGTGIAAVDSGSSAGSFQEWPPAVMCCNVTSLPRQKEVGTSRRRAFISVSTQLCTFLLFLVLLECVFRAILIFICVKTTCPNLHVTTIDVYDCWSFLFNQKDKYNTSMVAKFNVPSLGGIFFP